MMRRMGRPGLVGTMARTAVVAGTATAVVGGVRNHQEQKAGRPAGPGRSAGSPAGAGPGTGRRRRRRRHHRRTDQAGRDAAPTAS